MLVRGELGGGSYESFQPSLQLPKRTGCYTKEVSEGKGVRSLFGESRRTYRLLKNQEFVRITRRFSELTGCRRSRSRFEMVVTAPSPQTISLPRLDGVVLSGSVIFRR